MLNREELNPWKRLVWSTRRKYCNL